MALLSPLTHQTHPKYIDIKKQKEEAISIY